MSIGFNPSLRDLCLAACSFAGDVARDAFPVVSAEPGTAAVRIRHIH